MTALKKREEGGANFLEKAQKDQGVIFSHRSGEMKRQERIQEKLFTKEGKKPNNVSPRQTYPSRKGSKVG